MECAKGLISGDHGDNRCPVFGIHVKASWSHGGAICAGERVKGSPQT
jgi:hypothetical protein